MMNAPTMSATNPKMSRPLLRKPSAFSIWLLFSSISFWPVTTSSWPCPFAASVLRTLAATASCELPGLLTIEM